MNTNVPSGLTSCKLQILVSIVSVLSIFSASAQSFKGKDGAANYSIPGTYIPNRYTALGTSVSSGAVSLTVSNIAELSGAYTFINSANPYASSALAQGDLIMIIQVQGADIATTDDAGYGAVTSYNNTGGYELKTVFNVSGNTIYLCQGLKNSYTQSGRARTQVIRVPRLSTLTIGSGVTVSALSWSGTSGGVVAIEADATISSNGTISANALGFRGGTDDNANSIVSTSAPLLLYRTTVTTTTAGKGESIAGNGNDYATLLNGANGRGAPANGGGGGNGHNSGGGGGSNAGVNGVLLPWNGTGLKSVATAAWSSAWNLETASFATDVSTGGGRGGYSYSNSNQDALTVGPGNTLWGGNNRINVGGFGGRPLDYQGNARLFMGGGGGAGDGNNLSSGNGGNGGGIIYLFAGGTISGTGTITANGQNGFNTVLTNIDAAGGAGAGGAIVIMSKATIAGITIQANGGKGGDQLLLTGEAEGPGGGGSGGFIATTSTSVSRQVNGGDNGISNAAHLTEFLPNGATQGASGTIAGRTYSEVAACTSLGYVLPVTLISFDAGLQNTSVNLSWVTASEVNSHHFELEKSTDGISFSKIALINATGNSTQKARYNYEDQLAGVTGAAVYYRLKMVDADTKFTYSPIRAVRVAQETSSNKLITYPNPATSDVRVMLPSSWVGKKVNFEMIDVAGRTTRRLERASASPSESLGMNDLEAGFYVVKATMGSEMAQQRIIKK